MKQEDTKVLAIRVPLEISNKIKAQAELDDRSVNYLINKILKAYCEQEKRNAKLQTEAIR